MQELRNKLSEKEFNNEFSRKLLDSENIFNEIYKICENEIEDKKFRFNSTVSYLKDFPSRLMRFLLNKFKKLIY